ncbi:MAG: Ig-like domain-containing protein [Firmicutes bacterium]|nr:Ig-like domain-containing protein [Bacillota bacterium]
MRRSFLTKAIVAVGVMASAMVLSSVAVLAGTVVYEYDLVNDKQYIDGTLDTDNSYFNHATGDNIKFSLNSPLQIATKKITLSNGSEVEATKGLKLEGSTDLYFTTNKAENAKVTIIYGGKSSSKSSDYESKYAKLDSTNTTSTGSDGGDGNGNLITYTSSAIASGEHHIKQGSGQVIIAYVKVEDEGSDDASASLTAEDNQSEIVIGNTLQLTGSTSKFEATSATYTSDDSTIASVDSNSGLVTGVGAGTTTITYTATGTGTINGEPVTEVSATYDVTVLSPKYANSLTISLGSDSITEANVYVGKNITLSATPDPSDATGTITWSSASTSIATVEEATGKITGKAEGDAVITASIPVQEGNVTKSVTIHVLAAPSITASTTGGSASDLKAATTTTLYDLWGDANAAGLEAGDNVFIKNNLYYSDQLFIYGNPSKLESGKYSEDFDGTIHNYSLKVKKGTELAVKLSPGSTVKTIMRGANTTEGNRYGYISKKAGSDAEGDVVAKVESMLSNTGKELSYTNDETSDITVYIAASSDCFISQIKVEVPASTLISDKLKASTITNNIDVGETGIEVTPMYATDGTNGYLVLQFTDNEALQNATSLTYAGDTYTSLYSSVVFDADTNDKLEDGLFLGFIVENDPTAYETIGGSITIE